VREGTRTAIIAALTGNVFAVFQGDSEVSAILVLDHVPEDARPAMPFLSLEDSTVEDWDTDTSDGAIIVTEVVVFSSYAGSSEAAGICDQVRTLLHHSALTVMGATVVLVTAEAGEIRRGSDGMTREGVTRVRVLLDDSTPVTS
jgi:hypothetical protein